MIEVVLEYRDNVGGKEKRPDLHSEKLISSILW